MIIYNLIKGRRWRRRGDTPQGVMMRWMKETYVGGGLLDVGKRAALESRCDCGRWRLLRRPIGIPVLGTGTELKGPTTKGTFRRSLAPLASNIPTLNDLQNRIGIAFQITQQQKKKWEKKRILFFKKIQKRNATGHLSRTPRARNVKSVSK